MWCVCFWCVYLLPKYFTPVTLDGSVELLMYLPNASVYMLVDQNYVDTWPHKIWNTQMYSLCMFLHAVELHCLFHWNQVVA